MDYNQVENIARSILVVMQREDMLGNVLQCIRKTKESTTSCKSTKPVYLARLIIFRLIYSEIRYLKAERNREIARYHKTRKIEEKKQVLVVLEAFVRELENSGDLKSVYAEVLYRYLVTGQPVQKVAQDLGISRDVVYQTKKRGLDKVLKHRSCPEILQSFLAVPKGRQKRRCAQTFQICSSKKCAPSINFFQTAT